jgi:glycosyltransferase involved in cell wall biosynthesis
MARRPLLVNATAIGRRVDGISVYGVNLLNALLRTKASRPLTVVLNEDARCVFPEGALPQDVDIKWVSARLSPSAGTSGNALRSAFANWLAVRHRDALVVGLSQLEAPIVGGRGVVMVHDMIPWLFRETHPRQFLFYRHYLGRALRRALAVITPSEVTKDDVCRVFGLDDDRVHAIHHGSPVPVATRPHVDRGRDRYILWIGRPDSTKNLAALLSAFRMIERRLDVRLIIAGDGSEIDVSARGLDWRPLNNILVLGSVTHEEKIRLLDRASVLVSPSLYEGFGFAPLEAMARGCPVVAALAGALPEVCGEAAVYVNPHQPHQIADAVIRVLTDRGLASALAERGRARTISFTWDASVSAHLDVFDRATSLEPGTRASGARSRDGGVEADALP